MYPDHKRYEVSVIINNREAKFYVALPIDLSEEDIDYLIKEEVKAFIKRNMKYTFQQLLF